MSGGIFFTKVRDTVSVVLAVVPLQLKLEAKVSITEEARVKPNEGTLVLRPPPPIVLKRLIQPCSPN
jgi:hypothetical protein